jgi:hypothetical protein
MHEVRGVLLFLMVSPGADKAWNLLQGLDHSVVCRNASVAFDQNSGSYIVRSFCYDFYVNATDRTIKSPSEAGEHIVRKYDYFFVHACLWYLIHVRDIPLSHKLIQPLNIKGGEVFFRGSHALPLENIAQRYGDDRTAFLNKGKEICAALPSYGDASLKLFPFPRMPVFLILWLKDDEYPPRADLLFDSNCEAQVPLDIIWSIAMVSLLVML